jgi:16S rRNA (cytidine1402-2'-O)-methyltransferase
VSIASGKLFLVATPIGNLEDLSARARRTLAESGLVLCEDTRVARRLLEAAGVRARTRSLHEHNERERIGAVLEALAAGEQVALISDAGTPLISDPGYRVVAAATSEGYPVIPVPGPCAAVAALSASGLPTDRFAFEGFLPPKSAGRRARLEALAGESRTLIFYESARRLGDTLADCRAVLGDDRPAVVAREMTKIHEEFVRGTLAEVSAEYAGRGAPPKGEIVLLVGGRQAEAAGDEAIRAVLGPLLKELPKSQAVRLAARISGADRRHVYRLALTLDEATEHAGQPPPVA